MRMLLAVLLLCVMSAWAEDWQTWNQRGLEAYRRANYPEAAGAFQRAAELNPGEPAMHLHLGMTWFMQYIPGAESPENLEFVRKAEDEFKKALQLDPNNLVSLQSLASLTSYQKNWDEAASWDKKVIAIDPRNKEAYYSLGVIAWTKFYPKYGEARAQLGMAPDSPGPLPPSAARLKLMDEFSSVIDEGISNLEKALEIDPEYDDAMAYMNLLIRERGDLRETPEEWQQDVTTANEWVQKTLETKKRKAEEASSRAPSPTPPDPLDGLNAAQPGAATRVQIRTGGGGGETALHAPALLRSVEPEYPERAREARVQGTVRFFATIDKDGGVAKVQVISGHPLLIEAARNAAMQWKYQPVLVNGEGVELHTQISVTFRLDE